MLDTTLGNEDTEGNDAEKNPSSERADIIVRRQWPRHLYYQRVRSGERTAAGRRLGSMCKGERYNFRKGDRAKEGVLREPLPSGGS